MKKNYPSMTKWERPEHEMKCALGKIPYKTWCRFEVDRMNASAGYEKYEVGKRNGRRGDPVVAVVEK